jgi:hypothetical protein
MDEPDPIDPRDPSGAPWPPESTVHRVHDRYLIEVVEGLGLCPFARKCRETARLQRPIFHVHEGGPTAAECADRLGEIAVAHPEAEVVLMTFVVPEGHALSDPGGFERFQRVFREQVDQRGPVRFYLAGFHPRARSPLTTLQPHSLAPLLRRTPDPVIQCVRADLLDRVREDPGRLSRLIESEPDYEIRAMLAASLSTGSQLSDDIALQNFVRVGEGEGREELEARLADIHEDRRRSYGRGE